MAFNPTLPVNGATVLAAELRGQFNGLKDIIDAVPAGPPGPQGQPGNNGTDGAPGMPGPQGPMGASISGAIVDFTNTVGPGQPASASASFDGANVRFLFSIPRGADGMNGTNGADGAPGLIGPTGPQGVQGFDGPQGISGAQGVQGPQGEVSNAALATAIAGTSPNSNGVATLGLAVSNPPTQAEMQTIANKLDELILALRR